MNLALHIHISHLIISGSVSPFPFSDLLHCSPSKLREFQTQDNAGQRPDLRPLLPQYPLYWKCNKDIVIVVNLEFLLRILHAIFIVRVIVCVCVCVCVCVPVEVLFDGPFPRGGDNRAEPFKVYNPGWDVLRRDFQNDSKGMQYIRRIK